MFGAILDDTADRWILGVIYCGGCLFLMKSHPHAMLLMGLGISGALANVIVKSSIYAEASFQAKRTEGKLSHPVDLVGLFGSAEFIIYFGAGVLISALTHKTVPMLIGAWLVVVMSHLSLLQRIMFAWTHYKNIDPNDSLASHEQN